MEVEVSLNNFIFFQDGYLPSIYFTPAEKALLNLMGHHSPMGNSEAPGLSDPPLVLGKTLHTTGLK